MQRGTTKSDSIPASAMGPASVPPPEMQDLEARLAEADWSVRARQLLRAGDIAPYREPRRPMMSRVYAPVVQLALTSDGNQNIIFPGQHYEGCCVCFAAPQACPCLALLPCIGEPSYIFQKRESSKYIALRENSIEWNIPERVSKPGALFDPATCEFCGSSCIKYEIRDGVKVVFYDDPLLDSLTDESPCCHKHREYLCGGRGEVLRMRSPFCGGLCVRASFPICCVPVCLPAWLCPLALQHDILVQTSNEASGGARMAMKVIRDVRHAALRRLRSLPPGKTCSEPLPGLEVIERAVEGSDGREAADGLPDTSEPSATSPHFAPSVSLSARTPEQQDKITFLTKALSHYFGGPFYGYLPRARSLQSNILSQGRQTPGTLHHNRSMVSRVYAPVIQLYGVDTSTEILGMGITKRLELTGSSIPPGELETSIVTCCQAPSGCPMFGLCVCCSEPRYIANKRAASTYTWIRENSIEWNEPKVTFARGSFCGMSLCYYDVQDHIRVLYFDDPMMEFIEDRTRWCNETRTICCGGQGERVRLSSKVCFGACLRGTFPCPFVPDGLACASCCAMHDSIHVRRADRRWGGAQMAVKILRQARDRALKRMEPKRNVAPRTHIMDRDNAGGVVSEVSSDLGSIEAPDMVSSVSLGLSVASAASEDGKTKSPQLRKRGQLGLLPDGNMRESKHRGVAGGENAAASELELSSSRV